LDTFFSDSESDEELTNCGQISDSEDEKIASSKVNVTKENNETENSENLYGLLTNVENLIDLLLQDNQNESLCEVGGIFEGNRGLFDENGVLLEQNGELFENGSNFDLFQPPVQEMQPDFWEPSPKRKCNGIDIERNTDSVETSPSDSFVSDTDSILSSLPNSPPGSPSDSFVCETFNFKVVEVGSILDKTPVKKCKVYKCNMCTKSYNNAAHLKRHKVSVHERVRYPCDQCDIAPFTYPSGLRNHKASAHDRIRFPCDQCTVSPFSHAEALKQHKASVHQGVRYYCDQCDVSFNFPSGLRQHKASAHNGKRYECDMCNTKSFKDSSGLRKHKAAAHNGVRYPCNKCDYKATQKSDLTKHLKIRHQILANNIVKSAAR